jgi:transposase
MEGKMGYKVGTDKQQLSLLPVCLDDYIPENHICRVITAFTEQLDMCVLEFKYAESKDKGCRPYDPRMMLNLYIYGYLHRVRSSRRLEAETKRNIEVMWLMNELKPDDKTISNFRTDNVAALRKTFREFSLMCRELELYGGEVEATDGTKFRANNSRKNNHNKTTVEKEFTEIDKRSREYLVALERGDKEEKGESEPKAVAIKAALERLRERKDKYEELKERVEKEGEVSTVDPDSKLMRSGGDARELDVCYNVQTVVDSKHHLIVDFDIAERSDDKGNLFTMSEKAKEVLGVQTLTNLADKGYYDGEDIAACEAAGVSCLVAKPRPGGTKKEEGFTRRDFTYEREHDCYACPCKNQMRYMRDQKHSDGKVYRVYANYAACGACPRKGDCTEGNYRQILRPMYQDTLDVVDERTKKQKGLYRKRQEIVEHPFGTIKAVWGYKQFLCRTKPKVTAEVSLAYLAYNMRRVINIFTRKEENPAVLLGQTA